MKRVWIIMALMVGTASLHSQDSLSLQQAVDLSLKNNYGILIARQQAAIAANEVTLGNAGMLPVISLGADQSWSRQNFNQAFISGDQVVRSGANSSNSSAFARLNWTIFDGMRMFATLEKLQALQQQSKTALQAAILQTVATIHEGYFQVVQLQQQVAVLRQAVALSETREQVARDQYVLGSGSRLAWLQAQVDLNADKAALLNSEELLRNAKITLNREMGQSATYTWSASDTMQHVQDLTYESLREALLAQNPELLQARYRQQVAMLTVEEVSAQRYPVVDFSTDYSYNRSAAEAGFLLSNQTNGATVGFSVSWPVFDGFNVQRQIENARMQVEIAALQESQMALALESQLATVHTTYNSARTLVALEKENLSVAKENLDVAMESYTLGVISALELREIQNNYIAARNRLLVAEYRWKAAEIQLLLLTGQLSW